MSQVLILNASYEPLGGVSVRHAIGMLVREVAVVEEAEEGQMFGPYPRPRVVRLLRYVAAKWRHRPAGWSKRAVLKRDRHRCAYCAGPRDDRRPRRADEPRRRVDVAQHGRLVLALQQPQGRPAAAGDQPAARVAAVGAPARRPARVAALRPADCGGPARR